MGIFKNISDIKREKNTSSILKGYIIDCKEKINAVLKQINDEDGREVIYRKYAAYAHLFMNLSNNALYISTVGKIDYVSDICISKNNELTVILHVANDDNRRYPSIKYIINLNLILLKSIELLTDFLNYMFSNEGLENICGIKKSIFTFKYKIDVSDTYMFDGYINLLADCNNVVSLLCGKAASDLKTFVRYIETYFINYKRFARIFQLQYTNFDNLDDLKHLGKLFKAKQIEIPFYDHGRSDITRVCKNSLSGIEHIMTSDTILKIDEREILRGFINKVEINELRKKYDVDCTGQFPQRQ